MYPAPNAYTLPTLLGPNLPVKKSLPAYTMRSRTRVGAFNQDLGMVSYR